MRKLIIIFFVVILACSSPEREKNVIRFWQFWSDVNTKPVIEELVAEFESQNPGIEVEITDLTWANGHDKLVISFAADNPPDLMELGSDWVAEFAANDLLFEIESDLPENFLYPATWKGKTYGLPWLLASRVLFFNVDLLKQADVDVPQNWDELETACENIQELGDDYFGFGCNSAEKHRLYKKFLPFLWSNDGRVLSEDGKKSELDSPEASEALEYYLNLCDCGLIESQRRLEEYFREGKIGFVISGGWLLRRLRKFEPEFEYAITPFFKKDGTIGRSFFGGEYLSVYNKSKNKEMAVKLAEFLTTKTNAQRLCDAAGFGFPPYPDPVISDSLSAVEAKQLLYAKSTPPTPLWVYIEQDLEDAIEAAMFDHGTPEEIFTKTAISINNKLKSDGDEN
jgi:multiple sugar transport system substrate-binding protein